jgi:pyruvate-formate lyase-activating enzyme
MLTLSTIEPAAADPAWRNFRFLTCSVLPVRFACNLTCPFCFSKSSISSLVSERVQWSNLDVEHYYSFACERGATRLVITGGGEPLLRSDDVVDLIARGRDYFAEIACFTNGTYLTLSLAQRMKDAGLTYLCYSRHHEDDEECRNLMGGKAPTLDDFFANAAGLKIRATCVMAKGFVDSTEAVHRYIARLSRYDVTEFTFKILMWPTRIRYSPARRKMSGRGSIRFRLIHSRSRVKKLPGCPGARSSGESGHIKSVSTSNRIPSGKRSISYAAR